VQVDEKELRVVVRMLHQNVVAQKRDPLSHFHNRVRLVNYGGCHYFTPMSEADVRRVDLRAAAAHHNRAYSNPAEFKVVLTGSIEPEALRPLVCKYLATLPPRDDPPPRALKDVTPLQWSPPSRPVVEDVPVRVCVCVARVGGSGGLVSQKCERQLHHNLFGWGMCACMYTQVRMVSPITQVEVSLPTTLSPDTAREDVVWLNLMRAVLETRLLQRLRFQFGEIYTVSVSSFFGCEAPSSTGAPRGDVSIGFTCDPANRQHLIEMALREVEALQGAGSGEGSDGGLVGGGAGSGVRGEVTEEELRTVVNLERLAEAESEQENSYWHGNMVSGYGVSTWKGGVQGMKV
jgi:predicted Zn-dependent peptidase